MAKLTPIKAIRAECLECSNGQWKEVRLCPVKNCPLYEYRNGHRPKEGEGIKENDLDKNRRLPLFFSEGVINALQTKERRAKSMYVTYQELIQIGIFIVALVGLYYEIFKGRK